ncbi:site-specific integrase [Actinomadura sp. KC216]|uniref:site-specific integrase n=1 Tax=Actinomadura sp. KC216 TaxID=2530370 RepID=UPI0014050617|nr:site-specific integrase [Actinomadura sp. KC216]
MRAGEVLVDVDDGGRDAGTGHGQAAVGERRGLRATGDLPDLQLDVATAATTSALAVIAPDDEEDHRDQGQDHDETAADQDERQAAAALAPGRRRSERAGLPAAHRLTPHSGRRTVITTLLGNDVPLAKVQDLAGHADPRTTRGYDDTNHKLAASPVTDLTRILAGHRAAPPPPSPPSPSTPPGSAPG